MDIFSEIFYSCTLFKQIEEYSQTLEKLLVLQQFLYFDFSTTFYKFRCISEERIVESI